MRRSSRLQRRRAGDAIRVSQQQLHVVGRARLQIEHAAGEHVGRDDVHARFRVDTLTLQPQERQRVAPGRFSLFPERNGDGGVAVGIPLDEPLESQVDERRAAR